MLALHSAVPVAGLSVGVVVVIAGVTGAIAAVVSAVVAIVDRPGRRPRRRTRHGATATPEGTPVPVPAGRVQRGERAGQPPAEPTMFVSWAHSDEGWGDARADAWRDEVYAFSWLLGRSFAVELDLFHLHEGIDWSRFGERMIRDHDQILVALSPGWRERYDGENDPGTGAGAAREADALRGIFARNQAEFYRRVKLVVLPSMLGEPCVVPEALGGVPRFDVAQLDDAGIEDLVRSLSGQQRFQRPHPRGVPVLPPDTSAIDELIEELEEHQEEVARDANDDSARLRDEAVVREGAHRWFDRSRRERLARRRRAAHRFAVICGLTALSSIGLLTGHMLGDRQSERTVAHDAARLRVPNDWRQADGGVPVGTQRKLVLAPPGADGARMTVAFTGATGPSLLDPDLAALLGGRVRPRRQLLGDLVTMAYTSVRPGPTIVWVSPTSRGVLTIACSMPAVHASSFMTDCRHAAASVKLTDAEATTLDAETRYARLVGSILTGLPASTGTTAKVLADADGDGELASAADAIVRAYDRVMARVRKTGPTSPMLVDAQQRLTAALKVTRDAYERLARAARTHDERAFRGARQDVTRTVSALQDAAEISKAP